MSTHRRCGKSEMNRTTHLYRLPTPIVYGELYCVHYGSEMEVDNYGSGVKVHTARSYASGGNREIKWLFWVVSM